MQHVHRLSAVGRGTAFYPEPDPTHLRRSRNPQVQFLVSFFAVNVLTWVGMGYVAAHSLL